MSWKLALLVTHSAIVFPFVFVSFICVGLGMAGFLVDVIAHEDSPD